MLVKMIEEDGILWMGALGGVGVSESPLYVRPEDFRKNAAKNWPVHWQSVVLSTKRSCAEQRI